VADAVRELPERVVPKVAKGVRKHDHRGQGKPVRRADLGVATDFLHKLKHLVGPKRTLYFLYLVVMQNHLELVEEEPLFGLV
jgi:hypothetical protein